MSACCETRRVLIQSSVSMQEQGMVEPDGPRSSLARSRDKASEPQASRRPWLGAIRTVE